MPALARAHVRHSWNVFSAILTGTLGSRPPSAPPFHGRRARPSFSTQWFLLGSFRLAAGSLQKQDRLLEEARKSAVAAEREAILDLIESKRADYANVYFGDYCLQTVAAAIRAREKIGG